MLTVRRMRGQRRCAPAVGGSSPHATGEIGTFSRPSQQCPLLALSGHDEPAQVALLISESNGHGVSSAQSQTWYHVTRLPQPLNLILFGAAGIELPLVNVPSRYSGLRN
jgi:hypothetical protein